MRIKIIGFIFLLYVPFCNLNSQNYYPEKRKDVSVSDYTTYKNSLERAYKKRNKASSFNIAIAYAYLGEPNDSIFKWLQLSLVEYKDMTCNILEQLTNRKNNFGYPIIFEQKDSITFSKICKICLNRNLTSDEILGKDTSLYNKLKEIYNDDQKYRFIIDSSKSMDNFSDFWEKQKILDSINVLKVGAIFSNSGYPDILQAGTKYINAPFFVIHHSSNIGVKQQYLPVLIKAVRNKTISTVLLSLILDRIVIEKYGSQIFGSQMTLNDKTVPIFPKETCIKFLKEWNVLDLYPDFSK